MKSANEADTIRRPFNLFSIPSMRIKNDCLSSILEKSFRKANRNSSNESFRLGIFSFLQQNLI
ncbi:hypothetical protein LEP1GSC058_2779 [Leptospira fainei serovar Hurstbridge str. BUT 6]|uniref:Uncharacterized protein n=1 Tax=Leptospira fainei serovar Hurstbridge str. BUT 6 TaxID=1193011 RepID=S3UVB3_9LEPT|nr:hypothetical protein LEP1GSC058_2779 [Leptospira fainei serovar Hurstbridge str. BUT 6]